MRTVTKTYQVYTFDELDERAKDKAINREIEFQLEIYNSDRETIPEIEKAIKEADRMQTPWFVGSYVWDYAKEFILACCRDYEYLVDGTVFLPEGGTE